MLQKNEKTNVTRWEDYKVGIDLKETQGRWWPQNQVVGVGRDMVAGHWAWTYTRMVDMHGHGGI